MNKQLEKINIERLKYALFAIIFIVLSYLNFQLILKIWREYNLNFYFSNEAKMIHYYPKIIDLITLYPIIGQIILFYFTIICLSNAFNKLKKDDKKKLSYHFINGMMTGIFGGLMIGIIGWKMYGLLEIMNSWIILGLIIGLIYWIIINLTKNQNI